MVLNIQLSRGVGIQLTGVNSPHYYDYMKPEFGFFIGIILFHFSCTMTLVDYCDQRVCVVPLYFHVNDLIRIFR